MYSSAAVNSQFISILNEVSYSLGQVQSCICSRSTNYAKTRLKRHQNRKAATCAADRNQITSTHHQDVNSQSVFRSLPKNWQSNLLMANTEWMHHNSDFLKTTKDFSYISTDSFLKNKYFDVCVPSRTAVFHSFKKQQFHGNQRRFFNTFVSSGKVLFLEETANLQPNNPAAQAEYLKIVIKEDPEYVIRRYESGRYATNEEVKDLYMKALLMTNRLTSAEAQKRYSFKDVFSTGRLTNSTVPGTEEHPVHVVMNSKKGSFFKEQFWNTIRFGLLVGVLLYGFTYMQTKMLNVNQKEILPDQSEKKYKFADVQGCDEAKEELQEVVEFLKAPEKFERLGAKLPGGVLLIGPPGTGKTLLARAIAGEADVPFFFASGSEFDEMFVGVGAARVRKLFAAAKEHAPCIIFIDELDAIGGTRVTNDHQPYSRMTLNQLLVELDGFDQTEGIIVIGATNFPEILDKALTRPGRFDSKVHVTMPDVRGRKNIINLYLTKSFCSDDVDPEVLARGTPGFSGADLFNLVNQAALRAASLDSKYINMSHFEWAKDKIIMGPERKSAVIEEKNRTLVAYHEGGHAIVAIFTKDAEPVHKATIVPRGSALGYVMQLPEKDELSWSRKQLLAKMDVCMGGRVAEEMIFGEDSITTGASSDMQQATKIARAMVTKYGMSDKVGTVLIDESNEKLSPELQSVIEGEVKRLINEAYVRAKNILHKRSKEHKRLAEALLKYETLTGDEVGKVIRGVPIESK